MADWTRYVGIPYAPLGRSFDGANCWGLVRLYFKHELGIDLPSYAGEYADEAERAEIDRIIRRETGAWEKVSDPREGDVAPAWVRRKDLLSHVVIMGPPGLGVLTTNSQINDDGEEAGASHFDAYRRWKHHIAGWYRHRVVCSALIPAPPAQLQKTELIVCWLSSPLDLRPLTKHICSGDSLYEIVKALGIRGAEDMRVMVNDREVPLGQWRYVRPKHGTLVTVRPLVQDPISVAVFIAGAIEAIGTFAASAVGLGGLATAAGSAGAGVGFGIAGGAGALIGGGLAAGFTGLALAAGVTIGLQQLTTSVAAQGGDSDAPLIPSQRQTRIGGGVGNEARRFQSYPIGFGEVRCFPPRATQAIIEQVGDELYARVVFLIGEGFYAQSLIDTVEINEVPLSEVQKEDEFVAVEFARGGPVAAPDTASSEPVAYASEVLDDAEGLEPVRYWRMQDTASPLVGVDELGGTSLSTSGLTSGEAGLLAGEIDPVSWGWDGTLSPAPFAALAEDVDLNPTESGWWVEFLLRVDQAQSLPQGDDVCLFMVGQSNDGSSPVTGSGWGIFLRNTAFVGGGLATRVVYKAWADASEPFIEFDSPTQTYSEFFEKIVPVGFWQGDLNSFQIINAPAIHFSVTWDAAPGWLRIYANGHLAAIFDEVYSVGTGRFTTGSDVVQWGIMPSVHDAHLTIGARRDNAGLYTEAYEGLIQEFALYDYAPNEQQIQAHGELAREGPKPKGRGEDIKLFSDVRRQATNFPLLQQPAYQDGAFLDPPLTEWRVVRVPGTRNTELQVIAELPQGLYFIGRRTDPGPAALIFECEFQLQSADANNDEEWSPMRPPNIGTRVFAGGATWYIDSNGEPAHPGTAASPDGGGEATGNFVVPDGGVGFYMLEQAPVLFSFRNRVTEGAYRVRYRAWFNPPCSVGSFAEPTACFASVQVHAIVGIEPNRGVVLPENVSLLGMRLRATDSGAVSLIAKRAVRLYDASHAGIDAEVYSTWPLRPTRNAAWSALSVLMETSSIPASDSEVIHSEFIAWATTARDVDLYADWQSNDVELFNHIAGFAHASLDFVDGKWGVVEDLERSTPTALFTPRNTRGLRATIDLADKPHAYICRYFNREKNFDKDEMIVYADGFSEDGTFSGTVAATSFHTIEINGITDPDDLVTYARRRLREIYLRNESFMVDGYIDAMNVRRGSRADIAHLSFLIGRHQARITSVTLTSSPITCTDVTIEVFVDYVVGELYSAKFWRKDGSVITATCDNLVASPGPTKSKTITFSTPIPEDDVPREGDLLVFGLTNLETIPAIVRSVRPDKNGIAASFELYRQDTGVFNPSATPAPPRLPGITPPASRVGILKPKPPRITGFRSGLEQTVRAGAVVRQQMHASFDRARDLGNHVRASAVVARWRNIQQLKGEWLSIKGSLKQNVVATGTWHYTDLTRFERGIVVMGPVVAGQRYEVQMRGVAEDGATGEWSGGVEHTVEGAADVPPDVVTMRLEGRTLKWDYPRERVPDLQGFLVRWTLGNSVGRGWETANDPFSGRVIAGNEVVVNFLPNRQTATLMVKALDDSNIESDAPAFVVANIGDTPANVVVTRSEKGITGSSSQDNNWPGTKTQVALATITAIFPEIALFPFPRGYLVSDMSDASLWAAQDVGSAIADSSDHAWDSEQYPGEGSIALTKPLGIFPTFGMTRTFAPIDASDPDAQIIIVVKTPVAAWDLLLASPTINIRMGSSAVHYYEWQTFKVLFSSRVLMDNDDAFSMIVFNAASHNSSAGVPPAKSNLTFVNIHFDALLASTVITDAIIIDSLHVTREPRTRAWQVDEDANAWPEDSPDAWSDGSLGAAYETTMVPSGEQVGSALFAFLDVFPSWLPVRIFYRPPNVAPAWPLDQSLLAWDFDGDGDVDTTDANTLVWPSAAEFSPWPGVIESPVRARYDFRLEIGELHSTQGYVKDFRLVSDVEDLVDTGRDILIGPLASRLPLTKLFETIATVTLTLQAVAGQTAVTVKVLDYDASGPLVQAFDSSDVAAAATISYIVEGTGPTG